MISLRLSICFIVILAGIISTHGSEPVSKCPTASNVQKRSATESSPRMSRTKRDPGCMNLKLPPYDTEIPSPKSNDTAKTNAIKNSSDQIKNNRSKREPHRPPCPSSGPCFIP